MKNPLKVLGLLCMVVGLKSCESAWVVFPKYPAPYGYQHNKRVKGARIEINDLTAEVTLGQNRGIYDYESPTPVSVRVTIGDVERMSASGLIRLEKVVVDIDGEIRYSQPFGEVAVAPGDGEKTVEGVFCSGKNRELSFKVTELPPEVALEVGQTLTIHAVVAVTSQGVTERAEVSSQYVGTIKRGVMRRSYVP